MKFSHCWVKHDAGDGYRPWHPKKDRYTGDCQVRALSTARGLSYREAWQVLYALQGESMTASFNLVEWFRRYPDHLGVTQALSFPAQKGRPRMTAATFCEHYSEGRFILRLAHHVVAVIDGRLFDTWNSSSKCVYGAWQVRAVAGEAAA